MCAGSAQVTLFELRRSCFQVAIHQRDNEQPKQKPHKATHNTQTPEREQPAAQLIGPCRQSEKGETGAEFSTVFSSSCPSTITHAGKHLSACSCAFGSVETPDISLMVSREDTLFIAGTISRLL